MSLEVVVSAQAREDIRSAFAYIAADNPDAARRWRRRLEHNISQLVEFPALGRDRSALGVGLRSMPFGNHLIFYRPARPSWKSFGCSMGRRTSTPS
jgi:toxin ParE1/3/4